MHHSLSRRSFLRRSAAAGIVLGFPTIVPSSVFGQNAPSNRIVMAAIGVGGMGSGNMNAFLGQPDVQMVAACDVDAKKLDAAVRRINERSKSTGARGYRDFRELFAKEKLDAVTIATPDHWHAILAVAAARNGCDIYGEKPLARSIREGRAIVDAVTRHGRIWQTGSWQRSRPNFHRGAELVRNGRIGKVLKVEVGLPNGRPDGRPSNPVTAPPPELDYDFWLGPAPWRPFTDFGRGSVHWDWRWIMDYSGGQLTDWAGHHIDIAHWGLGFDYTGPQSVEGKGEYPKSGLYDVPVAYKFTCKYKDGTELVVANAAQQPMGMGTRWIGEKGWIHVDRGDNRCAAEPASILRDPVGPGEIHLVRSTDHHRNFLDGVKTRRLTITPAEVALRSISVGLLGEIAMLTGRKIRWNPETEEIVGDPRASALLGRAYRSPWTLG